MHIREDTLDDLMGRVLRKLLANGRRINPGRGSAVELTGVLLQLSNPRARLSRSESRGRVFSALGELLWYLAKTNKLSFIQYYIPEYVKDSDDGATIHGGYGPRLFARHGINQVGNVIALLRKRPDSRRAVIQLFDATDLRKRYKDIPCTCTLQFILRGGKLNMLTSMRSNDAYLGLPHDVFAFTMLQELVACTLGAGLGNYYHVVGSLHLYDDNRAKARQYLREGWHATTAMPPMPFGRPWRSVESLLRSERMIRERGKTTARHQQPYWSDLVRLLEIFWLSKQRNGKRIAHIRKRMASRVFDPYINVSQERASRA